MVVFQVVFLVDMEEFIQTHPDIDYWIFGHTHYNGSDKFLADGGLTIGQTAISKLCVIVLPVQKNVVYLRKLLDMIMMKFVPNLLRVCRSSAYPRRIRGGV